MQDGSPRVILFLPRGVPITCGALTPSDPRLRPHQGPGAAGPLDRSGGFCFKGRMESKRHRSPRTDTCKCVMTTYAPFMVARMPNVMAELQVKGGMGTYVPKSKYKAQIAKQRASIEGVVAESQKLGLQ